MLSPYRFPRKLTYRLINGRITWCGISNSVKCVDIDYGFVIYEETAFHNLSNSVHFQFIWPPNFMCARHFKWQQQSHVAATIPAPSRDSTDRVRSSSITSNMIIFFFCNETGPCDKNSRIWLQELEHDYFRIWFICLPECVDVCVCLCMLYILPFVINWPLIWCNKTG